MDGSRQDGFDLVLGAYEVPTSSRGDNPFDIEKPLVIRLVSVSTHFATMDYMTEQRKN